MATNTLNPGQDTADRELVLSRLFDAPRELVWKAWTEPDRIGQWWGPIGFTTTTRQLDLRPGGSWRFVMHGPDGTDYLNKVVYHEVTPPSRLVYEHTGEEGEPVRFTVTVTIEREAGRTRLTMRMLFPTADELRRVNEKYGAIEGAHQMIGRLAEYLAGLA